VSNPFFPDAYADSAYAIDYAQLYRDGVRGIIFDIDNTLVYPDAPADDKAAELFGRLRAIGLQTVLVSNNNEKRVGPFAEALGTPYVCKALKPSLKGYRKALSIMNLAPGEVACIGDQIYTDIWGAKRLNMRAFLTAPFTLDEEPQIRLKRLLEKPVLAAYLRGRKETA